MSTTSLIKKPHEIEVTQSIRMLIYGQPGLGKTTLGASASKPLLIDTDGGVNRMNPIHAVPTVQAKNYGEVLAVLEEDLTDYDTILFDTAGKTIDMMSSWIIAKDPKKGTAEGALTLQGYGVRKAMFQALLRKIGGMGKHVIFIAHEIEVKNGEDKIIRPEVGGSSANDLMKELDLVGYLEAVGKNRTLSFNPTQKFYAKNTCQLPELMVLPDLFEGGTSRVNNFMNVNVIEKFKTGLKDRAQMAMDYSTVLDNLEAHIERVTPENINEVTKELTAFNNHIWDSKIQAARMLKEKAASLHLVWNKTTSSYEPEAQV